MTESNGSAVKAPLEEERFAHSLETLYRSISRTDPLIRFRDKAWDHFLELGLPTKKTSEFQYVPLRKLYAKEFQQSQTVGLTRDQVEAHVCKVSEQSFAVFVNGRFEPLLSCLTGLPKKAMAIPLHEAFRTFGSYFNNQAARILQEETDPFAALNAAFCQNALFFYLPPNSIVDRPIHLLHFVTADQAFINPRVEFFCGALSEAFVLSQTVYMGDSEAFVNGSLQISLDEGARIHLERKAMHVPAKSWLMDAVRVLMKKDSSLNALMATEGSETVRDDYRISLVGPNAEAFLSGVWNLEGKREAHTHVKIDHQAPYCRSNQLFKGILNNQSKSSFEGKIFIQKAAQKTEAYQLNQNLLLDPYAMAYTKPNLEIFADDVKASHGATIGKVDDEALFYLQTRGIPTEVGKKLLVSGFCGEVLDKYAFLKK
jgi:Fe-S cluster assembly protein SufD